VIKILFVCLGNICRSPMAEFIMKELVKKRGLEDEFEISSAATSSEELGNAVYPPVQALLRKRGISCDGKFAVKICAADYDKYDYIIGMDSSNMRNMQRIFGGDREGKLYKLMSFTGSDRDVADPWYTRAFSDTENDVYNGCTALLNYLTDNK